MRVFEEVLQEKYLTYFTTTEEFSLKQPMLDEFLGAMFACAAEIAKNPKNPTPYDIIDAIEHKLALAELNEGSIVAIAADERLGRVNASDIFVMLWFLICRNFLDPAKEVYLRVAQNGTVGRLLARLFALS